MKITNELLTGNPLETKIEQNGNREVKGESFEEILLKSAEPVKGSIEEVSNGDTYRKEIFNNNTFEGGGWAYVDKYGYSHVVSDYLTAGKYKKPGTEVYQYNGRYGGGYGLDENNNRLRIPIPGEIPYGNDLFKQEEEKAKIADLNHLGKAVGYLEYLETILYTKKII